MTESNDREALRAREQGVAETYERAMAVGLELDMTRGKPSPKQLDLANDILALPGITEYRDSEGADCRNYGGLDGLPRMRRLFGEILGCPAENVIIGGNSSLTIMHDTIVRAFLWGVPGGKAPWGKQGNVKFLCPVPGYDRHFAVTQHVGIDMLNVGMTDAGPDMDQVEALAKDPLVKGIWCVPKYSNPTGVTYSDEVVERLAKMEAATDFRIMWDNAYAEHHLSDDHDRLANMFDACRKAGNEDRLLMFASSSKMSFAGAGVAAMAASMTNVRDTKKHLSMQTIGPDKVNQLRHLKFFGDIHGLRAHMSRQAEIIRPKFELVQNVLGRELGGKGIASWSNPKGGYFIDLNVPDGCAKDVVALAAEAGVKLTKAGATFPQGQDPRDRNIRLAPTLPSLDEIKDAMKVLAICVELSSVRKQLAG
jgi:DNA-binding transcriptional MocR family regulator